ncbi:hypothetical protein RFI_30500 [Reticulomyxa filosa]|uniref:Uncharacterized protein n=1 Tax=Reticulomyxa filosa TaxID=46433 RepID=X6LZ75_RETFI|nr:hypothetical protein RFI_30500 [Reticulomyxa filosa]|eukprot:ETO06894.1 hypothetical protein RFI_30500 [Reticulomyxa filosa]
MEHDCISSGKLSTFELRQKRKKLGSKKNPQEQKKKKTAILLLYVVISSTLFPYVTYDCPLNDSNHLALIGRIVMDYTGTNILLTLTTNKRFSAKGAISCSVGVNHNLFVISKEGVLFRVHRDYHKPKIFQKPLDKFDKFFKSCASIAVLSYVPPRLLEHIQQSQEQQKEKKKEEEEEEEEEEEKEEEKEKEDAYEHSNSDASVEVEITAENRNEMLDKLEDNDEEKKEEKLEIEMEEDQMIDRLNTMEEKQLRKKCRNGALFGSVDSTAIYGYSKGDLKILEINSFDKILDMWRQDNQGYVLRGSTQV